MAPRYAPRPAASLAPSAQPDHRLRRLLRGGGAIAAALTPVLLWGGSPTAAHAQTYTVDNANNPLSGTNVGSLVTPALGDLDGDLDLDLVIGTSLQGELLYFENTGTVMAPAFTERTGAANPLPTPTGGNGENAPALVDLDGDLDLDLVLGNDNGTFFYYENTGTVMAPAFTERTGAANPLNGFDIGQESVPTFGDLDGDNDLDLVVGEKDGLLNYFENTGTTLAPAFTQRTGAANPLDGDPGARSSPALVDLDGDGDLDVVVGEQGGSFFYFENTGTALAPAFSEAVGVNNPFDGIDVGGESSPVFGDLDGDLSLEAVVGNGNSDGIFNYLVTDFEALPVELASFDAKLDGSDALLSWTTTSETNNAGFQIERLVGAPGAEVAETLGFVGGAGTTLEAQHYTFRTNSLTPGVHRFRLRQVDYDGAFSYSATVEVSVGQAEALRLAAYPNPANAESGFALEVSARHSGVLIVEIYDVLGRRVDSLVESDVSAGEVVSVRVGGLLSGVYFVRARQGSHVTTRRVSVVR